MRPCVAFEGNPLNYIRKRTDGKFDEPKIDTTVFRQNTEGMYAGIEWTNPPENVRGALASHAKFKAFAQVAGPDIAVSVRVITRDRKSTRLNSSHTVISYAVFCLKKKKKDNATSQRKK